jgi:uncharacterized protein YndB with AHSA1/START domain
MAETPRGKPPAASRTELTLPSDEQILITRELDAPPHLVFKAWTTPELVKRWWCGQRGHMTLVEIDLRVGGAWRYVMVARGGFEVAFHGTYREIIPNQRIVTTEVFEMPGPPMDEAAAPLNIITFTEVAGRTRLEYLVQCPTQALRDLIIDSGMEAGVHEQMDALDRLASASS